MSTNSTVGLSAVQSEHGNTGLVGWKVPGKDTPLLLYGTKYTIKHEVREQLLMQMLDTLMTRRAQLFTGMHYATNRRLLRPCIASFSREAERSIRRGLWTHMGSTTRIPARNARFIYPTATQELRMRSTSYALHCLARHSCAPSVASTCCIGSAQRAGPTPPWWLALLACGGAYWPLAFEPSAMTSRHPYYCGHPRCRGHPPSWVGIQHATSAHGVLP